MVIPRSLRDEAGVAEGTLIKVSVLKGGQFLLTPQVAIDRSLTQAFRELTQVVAELRNEAKQKALDTMPSKEIKRAVSAARRDLKKGANSAR